MLIRSSLSLCLLMLGSLATAQNSTITNIDVPRRGLDLVRQHQRCRSDRGIVQ